MVSHFLNVAPWMLPVILMIAGAPPMIHADTLKKPAVVKDPFSGMVKIPAGRFRMGLSFDQVTQMLEMCTRVDTLISKMSI